VSARCGQSCTTPASVEALGTQVRDRARAAGPHPHALVEALQRRASELGVPADAARLRTAIAGTLVDAVATGANSVEAVQALPTADVRTSDPRLSRASARPSACGAHSRMTARVCSNRCAPHGRRGRAAG
jgi:hypothetical protein